MACHGSLFPCAGFTAFHPTTNGSRNELTTSHLKLGAIIQPVARPRAWAFARPRAWPDMPSCAANASSRVACPPWAGPERYLSSSPSLSNVNVQPAPLADSWGVDVSRVATTIRRLIDTLLSKRTSLRP